MWAQAAAAALPIIAGLIGEALAAGDDAEADRLRQEAMAQYNISAPELQKMEVQAIQSQAATAQGNPQAKAARMDALRMLQQRGAEGYNAEDRAAIGDTLSEVDQQARGRQQAITQSMDPNSGAAIAAQLSNAQNASQVANKRGLDIAAGSRRQALQSIAQGGKMAGDIDTDEFGQAYQRGGAQDAISQFNQRNSMDAQRFNAQQVQQGFGNQMDLAGAKVGVLNQGVEDARRRGARKRGMAKGLGEATQQGTLGAMEAAK